MQALPLFERLLAEEEPEALVRSCAVRTLSDIIVEHQLARVDLVKIDCEGDELAVLQGLDQRHWPLIQQVQNANKENK